MDFLPCSAWFNIPTWLNVLITQASWRHTLYIILTSSSSPWSCITLYQFTLNLLSSLFSKSIEPYINSIYKHNFFHPLLNIINNEQVVLHTIWLINGPIKLIPHKSAQSLEFGSMVAHAFVRCSLKFGIRYKILHSHEHLNQRLTNSTHIKSYESFMHHYDDPQLEINDVPLKYS